MYKGDRESFLHRHQKGAKEYPFASISNGVIYSPMNPKNVWRLQGPHQTHSHNLRFKITDLARRFNPKIVLRQDFKNKCGDKILAVGITTSTGNLEVQPSSGLWSVCGGQIRLGSFQASDARGAILSFSLYVEISS